jgi:hypothetical protein
METIKIEISAQTLNTIGAALQEIPHKFAAPALKEINEQVQKHMLEKQNGFSRTSGQAGSANGVNRGLPDADAPNYAADQPAG